MIEYNEKKAVQPEEPDIKPSKLSRRYRPKYLKKPEKRKSLRALTCFALIFAALTASVAGTYAKYISPTVEIPPFSIQAAAFVYSAEKYPNIQDIKDNKSSYGLQEKDEVLTAFTVSNAKDGKISEVSMDIDVELQLMGYTTIRFDDNYTVVEEDKAKTDALKGLKIKLMCNADGSYKEVENNYHPISPASFTAEQSEDLGGNWHIEMGNNIREEKTVTCVLAVDTSAFTYSGKEQFTFGKPKGMPDTYQNLSVTVNQAN